MLQKKNLSIGVFDSGVGGISVLAELVNLLPAESYVYYGDSHNAPYGVKETSEIEKRSLQVANLLINEGIKLLVVACNTATSAAINQLRQQLNIPVIGMEPAVKPAIEQFHRGKIVVMATPLTLKEKKFGDLIEKYKEEEENIIKLPCPGLVEIIENYGSESTDLEEYLYNLFDSIDISQVSTIVLGCTHYVFIKKTIHKMVGEDIKLIDGNLGTANNVKRVLMKHKIINSSNDSILTSIKLLNSSPSDKMLILSRKLLEERLQQLYFIGKLQYHYE